MRKSKLNKSFDRDFESYKTNTICYIHSDNIEIPVKLNREGNKLNMKFSVNDTLYISKEIICAGQNDYFDLSRIEFEGITLRDTDLYKVY